MKHFIQTTLKLLFCFALCGGLYLLLETFWDGSTALEMFYLAGCMSIPALLLNDLFTYETDFLLQCGTCTILATLGEGITGHLCNMNYSIWDYRNLPLTFWDGQINLFFCIIWFLLFAIFIPVLDYIEWQLFGYQKDTVPYYIICKKKIFDLQDVIQFLQS